MSLLTNSSEPYTILDLGFNKDLTKQTIFFVAKDEETNPETTNIITSGTSPGSLTAGEFTAAFNLVSGYLQSSNFEHGVAGWQLSPTSAEINVSTALLSLDIPDTTTANSFHVESDGDTFWGATTLAGAVAKILKTGAATFTNITLTGLQAGSSIDVTYLSGTIPQANLNIADLGWIQTCVFSSTDADTVSWGAGTFTSANGTAYSIDAGNTGNMSAKTYIYFRPGSGAGESDTTYQITTTQANIIGAGKVLIAVAQNGTSAATYILVEATQVVADNMVVNTLSAISADLGTITAGSININSGKAVITSTGDATFRSYNLLSQYTAGEAITIGKLLCLKHRIHSWGDDSTTQANGNRETTAIHSAFTYVDSGTPNTTYEAPTLVYLETGAKYIYGKLDFSSNPPGIPAWNEVDKVLLRIYVVFTGAAADTVALYRVTADWAENTITWNNKPANDTPVWASSQTGTAFLSEPMATVANLTDDGYIDFDITQLYRLWSATEIDNYGFVIKTISTGDATIGGRTREGGGSFNQAPCLIITPTVNAPGSGNGSMVVNDGKAYHASNADYNKVKNVVGIAGNTVAAAGTVDVYALADRSIVPSSILSVTIAKNYYLTNTTGTIGVLTNDIILNNVWNLKVGIGTGSGLCIDFDKNPVFIKSETYPGTAILPPSHARMAIIDYVLTLTETAPDYVFKGRQILYKDRLGSCEKDHANIAAGLSCQIALTFAWASDTPSPLTITATVGGDLTVYTLSATIYWYK